MLEFKERVIELKLRDGEKISVNFPTAKRMNEYSKEMRKIILGESKEDDYELTVNLIEEHGLNRDVIETLYSQDIKDLVKAFDGQKKT